MSGFRGLGFRCSGASRIFRVSRALVLQPLKPKLSIRAVCVLIL